MNTPAPGINSTMVQQSDRPGLLRAVEERLEIPMVVLSFVWLALFVAELVTGLGPVLTTAGTVIWVVFIADFALRLWLAGDRPGYLKRNWLTAVSLIVPALRMFRAARAFALLRSARGVRVVRVAGSLNRALRALGRTFQRRGFGYMVAATVLVVLLGSAAILAFERGAAGFEDYGDALWWTAMMVLSVGSETWPESPEGRSLGFFLALYGFSIVGYVAATLTSFFLDRDAQDEEAELAGSRDLHMLAREVRALRRELENARSARSSPDPRQPD